ncbi:hypothetical protein [Psychroserpens luteus]|uniref:Uncharacterized protein n=1 Tax=Psychroserpens luteus TaxID=1434066 RepID=A0ABW5ZX79_9FLAO|nr:hypothetical protein [Psychroserpens luteus]
MKNINFKSIIILTIVALAFFSCQKEDDATAPENINERFKVPSIDAAKFHFEKNNKIPILGGDNNGV